MRDRTQLSENFWRYEFACKCGCGFQAVDVELLTVLQRIRSHYGRIVTINSGARCLTQNTSQGGFLRSRHLRGEAADFVVEGIPAQEIQALIRRWYPGKFGIGRARDWTHLDVRPHVAEWTY